MNVSVCMIVRNEQDNIERALRSIPSEWEKIVVDTGSTDQTIQIAEANGASVSRFTWCENFAAARNSAIIHASGSYILFLDADEELEQDAARKVELFISRYPQKVGAVLIHNLLPNEIHKHRMVRFFSNNGDFAYKGIVHESLYDGDQPADFEEMDLIIYHYGYQAEAYQAKDKYNRYVSLYQKELQLDPNNGYMQYQLGKLYFSHQDYTNAYHSFSRSLQFEERDRLYFPVMLVSMGYTLKSLGKSMEAEQLLTPYAAQYPNFPDLPFLLALLAMDTGKMKQIEIYLLQCLRIGETKKYTSVDGVGSYKATYNLGVYYEVLGNTQQALQYYEGSASQHYEPAVLRLKKIRESS